MTGVYGSAIPGTMSGAHASEIPSHLSSGAGSAPIASTTVVLNPSREFTTQELQLSGACDWYKIARLVESETKLMKMLYKAGLTQDASNLKEMRNDVLVHRMANSPYQSAKVFFRNNCANDAYIAKWRHDIDTFVRALRKTVERDKIPTDRAIDIVYQAQLLRQQARVSLPYTGFYNPVPKVPSIPPKTFRDPRYEPRFTTTPLVDLGLKPVKITTHEPNLVTSSLNPNAFFLSPTTNPFANFL